MIRKTAQPDALLAQMDALADPTRLRLLRLLEGHELGVAELCDVLQMPQSTVSRHLKVLGNQGWTRGDRRGTTNVYRMLTDELDGTAMRLWRLAREQMADWATIQQDELRLAQRLQERRSEQQAFFEDAAGQWDKLREELYGSRFGTMAHLALMPDEWTIADLGCGTAQSAVELAPHARRIIGVDNSTAMLKAARQRAQPYGNIDLRQGELEALPIDDGECDAALMLLVLVYVDEPAVVLAEAHRVLRPGGRVVIADLLAHDRDEFRRRMGQRVNGFTETQLAQMLDAAGFERVRCQPVPPQPQAKGPALFLATAVKA